MNVEYDIFARGGVSSGRSRKSAWKFGDPWVLVMRGWKDEVSAQQEACVHTAQCGSIATSAAPWEQRTSNKPFLFVSGVEHSFCSLDVACLGGDSGSCNAVGPPRRILGRLNVSNANRERRIGQFNINGLTKRSREHLNRPIHRQGRRDEIVRGKFFSSPCQSQRY